MNRFLLATLALALVVVFPACNNTPDSSCVKTGCAAGSTCNASTGKCDQVIGTGGGGGSSTGGGNATGGGGDIDGGEDGGSTGGGGGSFDAGFDAGVDAGPIIIDPYDDGGVFLPGDICSFPIAVNLATQPSTTLSIDMSTLNNEYLPSCSVGASGNDAIFKVTTTAVASLTVTATNTASGMQDAVLSLLASPCAAFAEVQCSDDNDVDAAEVLTVGSLPAGTWYVLLDTHGQQAGTFDVTFDLGTPVVGPDNDSCSTAQVLAFTDGGVTVSGTTIGAFNDNAGAGLSCAAGSSFSPDVYYSFTLTDAHDVRVSVVVDAMASALIPAVEMLEGCGGTSLKCAFGDEDDTVGQFTAHNVQPGTYFVVVDGATAASGDFAIDVQLSDPVIVPVNDTCAAPATLVPNMTQMVNVIAADRDLPTSLCASSSQGGDVVYSFTITQPQKVTLNLTSTDVDSDGVVALRTDCADNTTELKCSDRGGSGDPEVLVAPNLQPGTYFVIVASYSVGEGVFGISLSLDAPVPAAMNETCATAATLLANASQTVDLSQSTDDLTTSCGSPGDPDVFFTFTLATAQHVVVAATGADSFIGLELTSASCGATSEGCVDFAYEVGRVIADLQPGQYWVELASGDSEELFGIELSTTAILAPTNESCTSPEVVSFAAGSATLSADLTQATPDLDFSSELDCDYQDGADLTWTVTIPAGQTLTVTATPQVGANISVLIRAPTCDTAPALVCADDVYAVTTPEVATLQNTTAAAMTVTVILVANSNFDATDRDFVSMHFALQ